MKILIIQTAFIGDVFLTLPLLQKVKEYFPKSVVEVVTTPRGAEIFKASPVVNKVWTLAKSGKDRSFIRTIIFSLKLRSENYDLVITPHRSFRTALIVYFTGAKKSIGFDIAAASFLYKKRVGYRKEIHEVARNLSLLDEKLVREENWKIKPEVKITPEIKLRVNKIIEKKVFENSVAIAPGSVWPTKIYPVEYYREIIHYLIKINYNVFLIGGKEEFKLCESLTIKNEPVFNFAGNLSILESVYLISRCKFLISNDSAPVHMAMASGTKTLTLYASTVPRFGFYPYLNESSYLSYDNLTCKPCGIHGKNKCPLKHFNCGKLLLPENVIDEINKKFLE